jgi:hypothetical protein
MFNYFLILGGSNYLRACNQGFTLIDYANLNSFTIHSSLPKLCGNANRRTPRIIFS